MKYFTAQHVRAACPKLSQRMLDYWVQEGIIAPSLYVETKRRKRTYFFTFEDIVKIRFIKSLREMGISLQRIRSALGRLKGLRSKAWKAGWLITDGRNIYTHTDDPSTVESLVKGEKGQLAFSLVALRPLRDEVTRQLRISSPINLDDYEGSFFEWPPPELRA